MSALTVTDLRPESAAAESPAPEKGSSEPALKALPKLRRRQKGLLAGVLLLLLTALGAVLAVNIHMGNTQYQLVQMQNDHRSLVHQNQALAQQVQFMESPQSISNSAVTLGMVMPATAGTFDLSSGEIASSADAASNGDQPSNFVGAPTIPGDDVGAALDVAEQAQGAPAGLLGAGALQTLAEAGPGQNGADSQAGTEQRTGSHGGTIPAPEVTP